MTDTFSDPPKLASDPPKLLAEEAANMAWINSGVTEWGRLRLLEASAVVRSLWVAMDSMESDTVVPLLALDSPHPYQVAHPINVSLLSMRLAQNLGLDHVQIHSIGLAALLHDIGMLMVPEEIEQKEAALTPEEEERVKAHTTDGARMVMEADGDGELAAVVAYEHHLRYDGAGYPELSYPRPYHQASALVQVCSVFDALCHRRPYRASWSAEKALGYIRTHIGEEFHPDLGIAFLRMMDRFYTG